MPDRDSASIQLLIVEPNDQEARRISGLIESVPHATVQIRVAPGLPDALLQLQANDFDGVLLGSDLFDADGLSPLDQIRAIDARVPMVVLGRQDDDDMALRAIQGGAQDFLCTNHLDGQATIRALRFAIARQRKVLGIQAAADTDPLTGMPNRRHLQSRFTDLLAAANEKRLPMSLCLMDLDHFKRVNDTHGHSIGDAVLKEFARLLTESLEGGMWAARFGGEEFAILMPGFDLPSAARKIRQVLDRWESVAMVYDDRPLRMTASAGVVNVLRGDPWEDAYVHCDRALYDAKTSGRNRIVHRAR